MTPLICGTVMVAVGLLALGAFVPNIWVGMVALSCLAVGVALGVSIVLPEEKEKTVGRDTAYSHATTRRR